MRKNITQNGPQKLPRIILVALEADLGSFDRVARRCGVSKSHVSMVASGRRTSTRVEYALIREAVRVARVLAVRADRARKGIDRDDAIVGEPAGISCGPRETGAR